jgi:3-deoxy-7-phosphoheptulonate synthase
MIDPMHGNTRVINGMKTRFYVDIFNEIKSFFEISKKSKVFPGGIHLELTGLPVTECIGGKFGIKSTELNSNYTSLVDPRLNGAQVLELIIDCNKFLNI